MPKTPSVEPPTDNKVGRGSGQVVGVAFVAIALGLVMYALVAGLGAADQLAGVIGGVAAVAGLAPGLRWAPSRRFPKKAMAAAAVGVTAAVGLAAIVAFLHFLDAAPSRSLDAAPARLSRPPGLSSWTMAGRSEQADGASSPCRSTLSTPAYG
jgi:hypothetical protein